MFQQAIKFDGLVLAIFQSFHWFMIYIFGKLALPFSIDVSKALNHFLVHSSVLNIGSIGIIIFLFDRYHKIVSS